MSVCIGDPMGSAFRDDHRPVTACVIRVCVLGRGHAGWIVRLVSDQSLGSIDDHVVFTVYEKILCEMNLRVFLRELGIGHNPG